MNEDIEKVRQVLIETATAYGPPKGAYVLAFNALDRLSSRMKKLEEALRPFAQISLVQDYAPRGPDMIDAPDLSITPRNVREARAALSHAGPIARDGER